jgi:hypothetical protein
MFLKKYTTPKAPHSDMAQVRVDSPTYIKGATENDEWVLVDITECVPIMGGSVVHAVGHGVTFTGVAHAVGHGVRFTGVAACEVTMGIYTGATTELPYETNIAAALNVVGAYTGSALRLTAVAGSRFASGVVSGIAGGNPDSEKGGCADQRL